MITIPIATQLSNGDLVSALARLAGEGRHRTADLIALLVALQTRAVHVEAGYPSLFRYCVDRLRLSEEETFCRLAASRVAARFPVVLERLREGRLTLTAVALLRKHLTEANHLEVLAAAEGRSKRETQALVARLAPQPDIPVSIRKLAPPRGPCPSLRPGCDPPADPGFVLGAPEPAASAAATPEASSRNDRAEATALQRRTPVASRGEDDPGHGSSDRFCGQNPSAKPAVMLPLSPGRYSLRVTISEETQAKLRRAHDLLAHTVPAGDTAAVLDRALTLLVVQLERRKYAALHPPSQERHPPPARRRATRRKAPAAATGAVGGEEPTAVPAALPAAPAGTPAPAGGATPAHNRRTRHARYIPADVRREVWQRDGGRCGYVASDGHRCPQTSQLEFHHTLPVADGGAATARAIALRCRDHHALETRRWFGEEVATYRGTTAGEGPPAPRGTRAGPSEVVPTSRQAVAGGTG